MTLPALLFTRIAFSIFIQLITRKRGSHHPIKVTIFIEVIRVIRVTRAIRVIM